MATESLTLPTFEELDVEEVPLTTPALKAGAFHLGKYCEDYNNEFMLCRKELKDPRKCVNEGKMVTACTMEFFRKVKKVCYNEFERYAYCIDKSHKDLEFRLCRRTQKAYDECILANMGIERPPFYYFCMPRIHNTKRPKPEPEPPMVFAGTPTNPDDCTLPKNPEKYYSRFWYVKQ